MKSIKCKVLVLLLAVLLTLPLLVACGVEPDGDETEGQTNAETETGKQPAIEKKDYDEEFTVIYCADTFNEGYFFIEEDKRKPGNDMDDKVYERMVNVETYLGVELVVESGGNFQEYTVPLKNAISAGDDSYQMVMTHVYMEVATLITSNYFRDFQDFESLQLEEDYWNLGLMQDLSINDAMYCGYNDFCLANCYLIGFNKKMVAEYSGAIGDLYAQVRNNEWTLDKLVSYSSLVSTDNGDGKWDDQDTYGFACHAWVPLVSFQHASDIPIVKEDADGDFYISPMVDNGEKIVALDEMIYNFMNADSTYTWSPFDGKPQLNLKSERVMFEIVNNYALVATKEETVKVGVLPYPKWDNKQESYKTLSWNGVLGIPTTVQNTEMVGDVIEMLAWYSEPVCTSFYETLLGSKVADAPEDVEMLNIVWAGQVSDMGLVFSSSSPQMDCMLYALAHHVSVEGKPAYATYYQQNYKGAERQLNRMFTKK